MIRWSVIRRREDISHATQRTVYDETEVYTFADVSQNTGRVSLKTPRDGLWMVLIQAR